jgi:predicted RNA-binding protein (virulence factor B family)
MQKWIKMDRQMDNIKVASTIRPGRMNMLAVTRFTDHGLILRNHNGDEEVLLPNAYVTDAMRELGRGVEVFVHTDSEDRPVATTLRPVALLGEIAYMEVVSVEAYGAFVDWGLPKNLLVPLSQQRTHVRVGDRIVVRVELDTATGRLYGTQRIGRGFVPARGIVSSQKLRVLVIARTPLGYKCVAEHRYEGMIYHNDIVGRPPKVGESMTLYVRKVRADGKLDLSLQPIGSSARSHAGAEVIVRRLREAGGALPLTTRSSPDEIRSRFGISKKQFKAGVNLLIEDRKVILDPDGIKLA